MYEIFMKQHRRIFLGAALVLLFSANAFAQMFEGVITMEITSLRMEKAMTMVISTKGDRSMAEMQMPQGNMKMYIDKAAGKMTTVMESMKMGMEMNLEKAKEIGKENKEDAKPPKVEATGEKKVINGHSCQLYRVTTHEDSQSNWWMTDDLPKSILNSLRAVYNSSGGAMRNKNGGIGAAAIEEMFKKGLVPI